MNAIDRLTEKFPVLHGARDAIEYAVNAIVECHSRGGKILLCGNGVSAAACEHMACELLKGFVLSREISGKEQKRLVEALGDDAMRLERGICAIPLPSLTSAVSAYANDIDSSLAYAQLVYAMGKSEDVLIAISTSGSSKNIVSAAKCGAAMGMKVIGLTGESGGELLDLADACIRTPENEAYKIQEYHLPIYNAICLEAERRIFGQK